MPEEYPEVSTRPASTYVSPALNPTLLRSCTGADCPRKKKAVGTIFLISSALRTPELDCANANSEANRHKSNKNTGTGFRIALLSSAYTLKPLACSDKAGDSRRFGRAWSAFLIDTDGGRRHSAKQ